MRYLIKKGRHRSDKSSFKLCYNIKELETLFSFDKNCWYDINQCGEHINKLIGVSFRLFPKILKNKIIPGHHWNSVRIGWRPNIVKNKIDLFAYYYKEGKRVIELITTINCDVLYKAHFEIFDTLFIIKIKTGLEGLIKMYSKCFNSPIKTSKLNYLLYPYYGGVPEAPQDMYIYFISIKIKN
jgi:hypothetical protein